MGRKRAWKFGLGLCVVCFLCADAVAQQGDDTAEQDADGVEYSECDRYIEAYVRSSARKMHRAMSRGEYQLEPVELSDPLQVDGEALNTSDEMRFDLFSEEGGELVGVIDRRREWEQTYLVAQASFGPIVVSQTWQARHLRDSGQACEPIYSTVEWPSLPAPTVDIEPFEYWGLRVVWRVPSPEAASSTERSVEQVLLEVMGQYSEES